MQQSLENVISKLQKMYQLKAIELERINEELEYREEMYTDKPIGI